MSKATMSKTVSDYTALLSGTSWWGGAVTGKPAYVTYSFETEAYDYLYDFGFSRAYSDSFRQLTDFEQTAASIAIGHWAAASGIRFLLVPPGQGDIRFGRYDFSKSEEAADAAAFAYFPATKIGRDRSYSLDFGGDVSVDLSVGDKYSFYGMIHVLMHEIGHALGLKHPFDGDVRLDAEHDVVAHTVMSYTGAPSGQPDLGDLDEAAIAFLYGPATANGNQIAPGVWNEDTYTLTQTGGSGADTIRGVSTKDVIRGGAGNDLVFGGAGDDRIEGEANDDAVFADDGDDIVYGGDGNDVLHAGYGKDSLFGGNGNDTLKGDQGVDTLDGGAGDDRLDGGDDADVLKGGLGRDRLDGGHGSDVLTGGDGADTLLGSTGHDRLDGGIGDDILVGGAGDDTLDGGRGGATLGDTADYSGGRLAVRVDLRGMGGGKEAVYHASGTEIGRDVLVSVENVVGTGRADVLIGNAAANRLSGGAGDDTLDGGAGADILTGGAGADRFVFGTGPRADTVDRIEDFTAGSDRLWLDDVFTGLKAGSLNPAYLHAGRAAHDANDRLIFDAGSHSLFYDADGTGAQAQVRIAVLDKVASLSASDFVIVV